MTDILNQQISHPVAVPDNILWSQDHIKFFALYDALTGLPNCFLFREQLQRSLAYSRRYETRTIVMFILLDNLTKKCEILGQKARIELLRQVSKQLLQNKRESDTLAYLDNDEFGLILENMPDDVVVNKIAQRVRNLISGPHFIGNNQVILNPTIIVSSNPSGCNQPVGMRSEGYEEILNQRKSIFIADTE
jgi:diguanylate cyclase (GGDEF)-like protein